MPQGAPPATPTPCAPPLLVAAARAAEALDCMDTYWLAKPQSLQLSAATLRRRDSERERGGAVAAALVALGMGMAASSLLRRSRGSPAGRSGCRESAAARSL